MIIRRSTQEEFTIAVLFSASQACSTVRRFGYKIDGKKIFRASGNISPI